MKNKSKKTSAGIRKVSFFSQKRPTKVSFFSPKFPSYLTSHTKPQNLRRYVADKKRLNKMDRKAFNAWGKPTSIPKKDMTWPQAKVRFPLLKPMKDFDRDGVINLLDCKPFDRKRQGFFHRDQGVLDDISVDFEDIKKLRTVGDVQRLEEDILRKEDK